MIVTHMDALCHFSWKDQLYNGRKRSETLSASGATWGSIYAQRQGIFTRGVLLDVAAARGVPLVPARRVRHRGRLRGGRKAASVCGWNPATPSSSAPAWSAWRRSWASRTSTRARGSTPSAWNGCTSVRRLSTAETASRSCPIRARASPPPMHMIGLASMGLPDSGLAGADGACRRRASGSKRWDYLLTTAPLRLQGGTSSPINPLCIF